MHPNRKFHIAAREEMAALVRAEGFGTLVVPTAAGLRAVHVPLLLEGERLLFHVSRGNAVHGALAAGAEALVVVNGPHAYVSPDWYGLPDRVPTWNYVAVELNGPVRALSEHELVTLLDTLSAEFENRLAPKRPWTSADPSPGHVGRLRKAIAGFALDIREWRGTAKVDQDKPPEIRDRIAAALRERGEEAMAEVMDPSSSLPTGPISDREAPA
ncbi:MAG: FMN-binding negative transcriptional regulator [Alphaproteobacteria bacterium]|nr:FMN-binding negative transcriptional regulator [Alphaproteobacteria bacterium]